MGENLTPIEPYFNNLSSANPPIPTYEGLNGEHLLPSSTSTSFDEDESIEPELVSVSSFNRSCESLRLLLSQALVELHGGQVEIIGTPESGYRYVVSLPEMRVTTSESQQ